MKNKTRAAIIEDEMPAAGLLKKMLSAARPDWEIFVLPGIVDEAVKWFSENEHPDILFLDIHLTDGNSFRFIEEAGPESMIVFTTAYDEYAVQAFSVKCIDYLLKPIHQERLEETLRRFERIRNRDGEDRTLQLENIRQALRMLSMPVKKYRTRFLVSCNNEFITLFVPDIAYFYTENKISFAVTKLNKAYAIDLSLNQLEEDLDPDLFFRVNRQFIVSAEAIVKVEPYFLNKKKIQVTPPFDGVILVSREKVSALKNWLDF